MKKLIIIWLIVCPVLVFGQIMGKATSENIRKQRPLGISATVGGGCLLGVSLDYFIIPQIDLVASFGLSQAFAIRFHFLGNGKARWSPFLGIGYSYPVKGIRDFGSDFDNGLFGIPLGVHFINKNGFSCAISAILCLYSTETYAPHEYNQSSQRLQALPSLGLQLGYHF
jgi:hypothetical protein